MPSIINTNLASLNAQNNLSHSQSSLATALQRLSSGLRINSAKDDAAGMAIASRMTSQINGSNQAARNANDGISLAQTAEGDLAQMSANLQRMRDLAVQSSNATNSTGDRTALQNEADQLRQEIDRVAQASSFNGVKLLDGTFTSQTFQVGANNVSAQDRITIASITSARTSALGGTNQAVVTSSAMNNTALGATDLVINGVAIGASSAGSDTLSSSGNAYSGLAKAAAINAASGTTGVTATVNTTVSAGASMTGATLTGTISINGTATASITTAAGSTTASRASVISAINAISSTTGVVATDGGADPAGVVLTAADGRNIQVTLTTLTAAATGVTARAAASEAVSGYTLKSANAITVAAGAGTIANSGLTAGVTATSTTGTAISSIDISSVSGAQTALASIDAAIATLNTSRAALGAYQNRFASAVSSLQTTAENLTASRSRIQDADFAAETSQLTRAQILQQAGTAMLAQANALPNGVMALLR